MSENVKTRRYDSSARRRQAQQNREAILAAAREQFLARGYAATSVPVIANAAGVSAETVYKAFGPKSALIRALWEQGLGGRGPVPAELRSDRLSGEAEDPVAVIRGWCNLMREVAPPTAPILLLVRDAAAADPEMAHLYDDTEQQRRARMRHNAKRLHAKGWLKPGVGLARATDILFTFSSTELYELLVLKSGWSINAYTDFVFDALVNALVAA